MDGNMRRTECWWSERREGDRKGCVYRQRWWVDEEEEALSCNRENSLIHKWKQQQTEVWRGWRTGKQEVTPTLLWI